MPTNTVKPIVAGSLSNAIQERQMSIIDLAIIRRQVIIN
jgi:hypothetical protein